MEYQLTVNLMQINIQLDVHWGPIEIQLDANLIQSSLDFQLNNNLLAID